jgi:hypothetical protein
MPTAQVVRQSDSGLIMITPEEVVTQALAGRQECNIAKADVDDRTAAASVCPGAVVDGLYVPTQPQDGAPLRQIGLEQPSQNNAAGVLPFLQRRWGLRHCAARHAGQKEQSERGHPWDDRAGSHQLIGRRIHVLK